MRILRWGIYAIVFCLPLYLVRFKVFGIPTTVLEIFIYVLFIFWLIKGFRFGEFKKLLITHYSLLITIILIITGVSLATIFSSDLRISAGIWKAWFIDPILFFIVLISVIKNSEQVKKVLFSLFLSGAVVSVIALVYLILGKLDPVGRLQGFYTSPNYLAMYLAPALLVGFWYYFLAFLVPPSERDSGIRPRSVAFGDNRARFGLITRSKTIPKTFLVLSSIYLFLSLIFTKSFGAWLGIIAAIGFGLVFYYFKLKKVKLAVLFLCLFVLASLFLGYFALNSRAASLDARLVIWQKAWEVFKAHLIFGIGPGTFGNYLQPHNIFLAFLLQTGLIGFIGFIWLLAWFFRPTGDHPQGGWLRLLLMAMMVYILIHGLVDTTYWKNDLSAVFWIIIGLVAVLKKEP